MSPIAQLLGQAQASSSINPKESERIYKEVLAIASGEARASGKDLRECLNHICSIHIIGEPRRDDEQAQGLRDQELALVKLGELFRDQKYVCCSPTPRT